MYNKAYSDSVQTTTHWKREHVLQNAPYLLGHYKTDLVTYIHILTGMVLDILQYTYYEHYVIDDY